MNHIKSIIDVFIRFVGSVCYVTRCGGGMCILCEKQYSFMITLQKNPTFLLLFDVCRGGDEETVGSTWHTYTNVSLEINYLRQAPLLLRVFPVSLWL